MRLIDTDSLELIHFDNYRKIEYAILSHTWGDGEATFQDWKDHSRASKKPGFTKIITACAMARDASIKYLWVDTNCIDKSSSAELSEAINSMFAWYKSSLVCYVYLADVEDPDNVAGTFCEGQTHVENIQHAKFKDSMRNSRWFKRGWTLQELLAPDAICFLTKDWKPIGSQIPVLKVPMPNQTSLWLKMAQIPFMGFLSEITGIQFDVLVGRKQIMSCSIGEKMSWMACRETTREEDEAYCLLGIFDINMPLLYGEGRRAFGRLQEEIIKQSTDFSLFSWQWPQDSINLRGKYPNLIADSTKLFSKFNPKSSNHDHYIDRLYDNPLNTIISLTNFGLSINLELIPTADPKYVFGVLDIGDGYILPRRNLWCIPLQKRGQVYYRVPFPPGPFLIETRRERFVYPIYIPRNQFFFTNNELYRYECTFIILFPDLDIGVGFRIRALKQINYAVLFSGGSTVSIPRGVLQNGKISAYIMSIEQTDDCSFVLYIGVREVNNAIQTAVRLFPAATSLEEVENTPLTFRPPTSYGDVCLPFSLVVSERQRFDPLPGEDSYGITFSVSVYVDQDSASIPRKEKLLESKETAMHD